jgi:hypothetical protein
MARQANQASCSTGTRPIASMKVRHSCSCSCMEQEQTSGLMRYSPRSARPASRFSTPYRALTALMTSARMGIWGRSEHTGTKISKAQPSTTAKHGNRHIDSEG